MKKNVVKNGSKSIGLLQYHPQTTLIPNKLVTYSDIHDWSQLETFELFFHHLCEQAGLNLDDCQSNPEIFTFEIEKERDEPILSE